jgi:predicted nucleic acid-binding protein
MMRLLPDTNTLSYLIKRRRPALDYLEQAARNGAIFLLGSIAHYELMRYLDLRGASRLLRNYEDLTSSWERCAPSFMDWEDAARLWAERNRLGRSVSDLDLMLAVLARREGAVLVTSNGRHFQGLGVDLEDWMIPVESP